ncbi:MAG: thioredoxin fold domain-containing protein [Tannerellaceae bacterium]|jgi:thioredoxin|nr:thioredoxin fold domain-containing protein [Tannerellaceae bacterium]
MKNLRSVSFIVVLLATVFAVAAKGKAETGKVVTLNKAEFLAKVYNYEKNRDQWVYEGNKPCIIDFYADWCAPCRQIATTMAELAAEYKDDIVIYKVNIDNEPELKNLLGIRSIPYILFVPVKGKPQMAIGALPKELLTKHITGILLSE